MNFINLNGHLLSADEAAVTTANRAFRYGYGLFETILANNGEIELKDYHWERLFAGMNTLQFELPPLMTPAYLQEQIHRTINKNIIADLCRIRLQVYAGEGGMYRAHSQKPEFAIMCSPVAAHITQLNENGLQLGIATGVKKSADILANVKSCNALIYAIAAQQAEKEKWNDALIYNTDGHIIESTIANIFWIEGSNVYTPPLSDGCVAGVMRRHVIALLTANGYSVQEKSLDHQTLLHADEVFLTNAIRKIKWVKAIGDKKYQNEQIKKVVSLIAGN